MKRAFVLGNGKSRLKADLNLLKTKGRIYGCNALYRDFHPDVLIAVDPKMVIEICQANYQLEHEVWTNPNKQYRDFKKLNFFSNPRGWSSGPTALLRACMDHCDEIYILGFDYHSSDGKFNNVYASTFNYKASTSSATYFGNWMKQTETIMREYPRINFFRVNGDDPIYFNEWKMINNFKDMNYEILHRLIEAY